MTKSNGLYPKDGSILGRMWQRVPEGARVVAAVLALLALGWNGHALLAEQVGLAHRVTRLEAEADSARTERSLIRFELRGQDRKLDLLICLIRAERAGASSQECIE